MLRILATALFALFFATSANAASRVWISECGVLSATNSGGVPAQACAIPFLATTTVDVTSSSQSVTMTGQTRLARVCAEAQIAVKGASGVSTSDAVIFAGACATFGVQPNSVVSVIANP
jgi:uncharacterized protein (DUF2345 family)